VRARSGRLHRLQVRNGEVKGYTKMLAESRLQAIERLREAAEGMGANAVIAMRFDCNELGSNMTEVNARAGSRRQVRGQGSPEIQPCQPSISIHALTRGPRLAYGAPE
jgi:hypothetical protein